MAKLASLASPCSTSLALLHPITKEELGVTIHGHTPDSAAWRKNEKSLNDPRKKQSLIIEKNITRLELDNDTGAKRRNLLALAVTGIDGLDDWEFSTDAVMTLFNDPQYNAVVEQWGDHLDDRANFFVEAEKTAEPTSVASLGLTPQA